MIIFKPLRGADFVIGSRYVPGGKIPDDWSFLRRMNSKWGNVFARYVAGMYKVRDCTAGFRAIRASIIRGIDLDELRVKGYAFQISLLHEPIVNGAKVVEVPVEFVDRKRGETKLGMSDIVEFMLNAWWIRLERSKTFLKFIGILGASGVVVNLAAFTLLLQLGMNKYLASPLAIEASIMTNFLFCAGCGTCVSSCQFHAITLVDGFSHVDGERCMGCGVCASLCEHGALSLRRDTTKGDPLEILSLLKEAEVTSN